jgi:nuclear pore complex protein Nup88
VHLELKHHAPQLKKIINDQHTRLGEAQQKLLKVEEKESTLQKRIDRAIQMRSSLEERLQQLRKLPGAHKKPLSRAERQFKSELGNGCLIPYFSICLTANKILITYFYTKAFSI